MSYSPWAELDQRPDITVRFAELDGRHGCYDPDTRTIWLDPRDGQAVLRSTLTHELRHADTNDECIDDPHLDRIQERRVNRLAAECLISFDDLLDALMWSEDKHELADLLWVDVATVESRLTNLTLAESQAIKDRLRARGWGAA